MDDINEIIAGNVFRFRRELDLSQAQLARRSGLASSMVAFIERGKRNLVTSSCQPLADGLGVLPHVLLMPYADEECPVCGGQPGPWMVCGLCRRTGRRPWLTRL